MTQFESPTSPIINSRVCGDCWNQLHGCPSTPRSSIRSPSKRALSRPISVFHPASPLSSSPATSLSPTNDTILPPSLTRKLDSTLPDTSSPSSTQSPRTPIRPSQPTPPPDPERSYGELDSYPLRRSSVICKASGGGRWEPKQIPVLDGYRLPIPGGKAPYEIEMEREELLDRQRKENPVVIDGEFQYRFSRVPEPLSIARSPHYFSTF